MQVATFDLCSDSPASIWVSLLVFRFAFWFALTRFWGRGNILVLQLRLQLHIHTHEKWLKKKNEKKLGKPTNRFRHLRWNIYVAVNGNVNKSWLRKIIDKTREIWSRKTCSKEILLHNCVNSMGEEWIRMFFFYLFFRCQCIFLTGELPKKTLNWSPYGQQRRNQTRALDWAICNHLDGFSFLFFFHSLCPSQQDLFLLIVVVIFFSDQKIGLSEAGEVANWAINLIKIGAEHGWKNKGTRTWQWEIHN